LRGSPIGEPFSLAPAAARSLQGAKFVGMICA
jgi:hypothetical protein